MQDSERNRIEAGERIDNFSVDNPADFVSGVPHTQILVIRAMLVLIAQYAAAQVEGGGDAAMGFDSKGIARETLRDFMQRIADTARVMTYMHPGLNDKFRMPWGASDQVLLATAKAWYNDIVDYEHDFMSHGMPDDFRTVLNDDLAAFEASFTDPMSGVDERVAATAQLGENIRQMMIAIRILDQVMRNIYAANPGKLAAWISASHVERPPKKKAPTAP